jgi:hypothetical protein
MLGSHCKPDAALQPEIPAENNITGNTGYSNATLRRYFTFSPLLLPLVTIFNAISNLKKVSLEASLLQEPDLTSASISDQTKVTNLRVGVQCAYPFAHSGQSSKMLKNKARYFWWILKKDLQSCALE